VAWIACVGEGEEEVRRDLDFSVAAGPASAKRSRLISRGSLPAKRCAANLPGSVSRQV